MSEFFADTITAALAGRKIQCAGLVRFDFLTATQRVWNGYGDIVTNDGNTWQGVGEVGSISGLDQAINGVAPEATISLSGVWPAAVVAATDSFHEARGRALTVYLQFFNASGAILDLPVPINLLVMERIEVNFTGPDKRDILIHCENLFTARGFPGHGWLSNADQQERYPGDRGCERIPFLQNHTVPWPRYR